MRLSVVATLFQSEAYIQEFYQRVTNVAKQHCGNDYEIILVNDGSPDNSLELAVQLSHTDSHIVVIDLSRNFGHHKAMMTGLGHARGEQIFLIDSDLEEDPCWLTPFSEQMTLKQCDVVYGIQHKRKGGIFERLSGRWFYTLFRWLTGFSLPENVVTARLMTKRYVQALLSHEEREVFILGLWHITGFSQVAEYITKNSSSKTTYTFRKKMSLFVNSVTSFSNKPLIIIFYLGILISLLSGLYISWLITRWMFLDKPLTGWTSVMASIWLLGGMIISFIGVVGIYLSKVFSEAKQRPYTIVRSIYANTSD